MTDTRTDDGTGSATPGTGPAHTGSRYSRLLGVTAAVGVVALLLFALAFSPADRIQGDAVRLMYIHVPAAIVMYAMTVLLGVASALWLRRRTQGWDVLAAAAAEVGLVFTGLTLATGMLWGRPTWGVYWVWDAKLTATALLAVLLAGYLALRRVPAAAESRSRRAAVLGTVIPFNLIIIHYSVEWWRTLHQDQTISTTDVQIDGLMLFTLFLGMVVGLLVAGWLLVHRFRVAWLEEEAEQGGLEAAIAERRAEAEVGR